MSISTISGVAPVTERPISRSSGIASATTNNPGLNRGFATRAKKAFGRPFQFCIQRLWRPQAEVSNTGRSESSLVTNDCDPTDSLRTHNTSKPTLPLPTHILEKVNEYAATRNQYNNLSKGMEDKQKPTEALLLRMHTAMERLRGRMEFNRQFQLSEEIYNSLGQRLEDLQHCVRNVGKEIECELEQLQAMREEMLARGNELIDMIQAWLNDTYGVAKDTSELEAAHLRIPFDLKVLEDAEAACDERDAADQQEEEFLSHMPFQPDGVTCSRTWITQEVERHMGEAKENLQTSIEQLENYQRIQDARDAGDYSYDCELPADEEFNLEAAIEATQEDKEMWEGNFQFCMDTLRELGVEVTSDGRIIYNEPPKQQTASCYEVIMWGVEEPDDEREPTEAEVALKIQESADKVGPWLDIVESSNGASSPTSRATKMYEGNELPEPNPSDSISQTYERRRIDLGYSVYRPELDKMEELRALARAALPEGLLPAEESESGRE